MADRPPLLGATVEQHLERTLWRLLDGTLSFHELTPALRAWFSIAHDQGYAAGHTAQQTVIDRLVVECDRLYFHAHNTPQQLQAIRDKRLDEGARIYWDEWLQGLHDKPEEQRPARDVAA